MNSMSVYLKLAQNNAWANATFWAAAGALSDSDLLAPRPGYFGSLQKTLQHILEVDLYYLDALEGGGQGLVVFDTPLPQSGIEIATAQANADARLIAVCQHLDAADLAQSVDLERPGGMTQENRGDLILHLLQHQIHHRGQAHVQLQDAGIAPPQLDEFFLLNDRAPAAQAYWPTRI